jgi:hypothetical protein
VNARRVDLHAAARFRIAADTNQSPSLTICRSQQQHNTTQTPTLDRLAGVRVSLARFRDRFSTENEIHLSYAPMIDHAACYYYQQQQQQAALTTTKISLRDAQRHA